MAGTLKRVSFRFLSDFQPTLFSFCCVVPPGTSDPYYVAGAGRGGYSDTIAAGDALIAFSIGLFLFFPLPLLDTFDCCFW
jgi:hypothetical protein